MRLRIDENKDGSKNFYILKSYRNEQGKSTTKIYKKLGTLEELSKLHEDPYQWAAEYVKELTELENQKSLQIMVGFHPLEQITKDKQSLYEGGYLFLQKIYYSLRLDYICKQIEKRHDFEYDLNSILCRLIYGRILAPTSKLGTYEYSESLLEERNFELQDVYRALDIIAEESDYIQSTLYKFSKKLGKRNDRVLYYDCTNYYFEIEQESGIRKYGISKENRPNPIVEMGLLMDGSGIPLAFCLHSGNTNEQLTLKPLEKQIINDFGNSKFIVCTDAGLSSIANRKFNDVGGRAFITAQSIKKLRNFQKEWALHPDGWKLVKRKNVYNIEDILNDENLTAEYYEDIFYKEQWFCEDGLEQRIIVTFSIKYRDYNRMIRGEQIERARKALSSANQKETSRQTDYKRFITKTAITENGEVADKNICALNDEKISEEEKYDGFYAVATDLEDPVESILAVNKGRWEIEESFRIMKSEFQARPVFVRKDDRILAHFTTCFLALTLFRYMEKKLHGKYTCSQIIKGLNQIKFLHFPDHGYVPAYTRSDFTDDLHDVFHFRTDYEILTNASMRKIISETKQK